MSARVCPGTPTGSHVWSEPVRVVKVPGEAETFLVTYQCERCEISRERRVNLNDVPA